MSFVASKSFGTFPNCLNLRWDLIALWMIDFEGHARYGVVENGVVCLKNKRVTYTSTRMSAAKSWIPEEETAIHGLKVADVQNYPVFSLDYDFFAGMRQRGVFGAHNRHMEDQLLRKTWARPPFVPDWTGASAEVAQWGPWVDTLGLMRRLYPALPSHSLSYLIAALGLQFELDRMAEVHCPRHRRRFHCALYDALASALLLLYVGRQPGFEHMTLGWLLANSGSSADGIGQHQKELFE